MILINNLLILFIFTAFAQTSALKTVTPQPVVSLIQEEESKLQKFETLVHKHPTAVAIYTLFETALNQTRFSEDEKDQILAAALFAAEKHQGQVRKDRYQTPYIIHPLGVANQLIEHARVRDVAIIQSALLHDTVEDTNTSLEELKEQFGERVAQYVSEVTDDKSIPRSEQKQLQIVHASEKSEGAALIKLSDKLYNVRDVATNPPPSWDQERRDEYVRWSAEVVNSLSHQDPKLKSQFEKVVSTYWNKT
jgi:guanosine-3',5'-bis(diphosphate) 3'-pyrophosphohydrolase